MTAADRPLPDAAAVESERRIQAEIDAIDPPEKPKSEQGGGAMQAGARPYPEPPMAETHQAKPGIEGELTIKPMYDAPYWKGSGKLEGFGALITGGDSGIGRSVAVLFAREGADVAIGYLSAEEADAQETKRVVEAEGKRCLLVPGDVADPAYATEAVGKVMEAFGRLDVLVNNAAFQEHAADIGDITDEHFDRTLKTNLYGYFYMARAAAKVMKPGAAIVNTGSVTGIKGAEALLDYSMTKGGIHAFTRSLGGSLVAKGIRVNCVAPGPVWTPLNPADKGGESLEQFGASVPMKRPAQPEEIAPAYVFLASPQCSSFITGEILPIIGGWGGG